ncbi:MAG: hypothetical protein RIR09_2405 [Pseudomonadota bacterium]
MNALRVVLAKAVADIRANSRLRWGIVLIALVVLVDGGLRWSDAVARQQQALAKMQADVAALKSGLKNESALQETAESSRQLAALIDKRLWTVSSEAVGQARMKDWLTDMAKRNIADQYIVTLGASRELGKQDGENATNLVATNKADSGIREFRANFSFKLTPRALEGVLLDIEGGEPFAAVESLLVKGQERRVEMTVRVLMRIQAPEGDRG